jgi:tetratricopeptide (TPR) repeat protein
MLGLAMISPCPDDDELTQFVERRLEESRRAEIETHCDACSRCRETVTYLVEVFAESWADDEPSFGRLPGRGATLGRYLILEWLGAGAMGAVYAAFDPELDRRVALKLLPPRAAGDASQLRARFLAEARAMASISHPNVIAVHDVGTHDDLAFFAMELVDGETLGDWLASRPRTTREIVDVFAAAGRGLAAAHEGGLVHRDFKPGNVLVGRDGRVRVIDFGLARFSGEAVETRPPEAVDPDWDLPETRTGTVLGTPAYMAPEQLEGERSDARADQFAFCVSLYEALYGRRPFEGGSAVARLEAIRGGPVRLGPGSRRVPRRLQRMLARGLAVVPADRFASMAELVGRLTARPLARFGPAAAMVVAVVGTGVGVYGAVTQGTGPRCGPGDERLAGVWDVQRRAGLVRALAGNAPVGSTPDQTARWVADRFDAYADSWAQLSHAVCVATVERHEQSVTMTDLQLGCLRRAEHQLRAHVDHVLDSGSSLLPRAVELVESLPSLSVCEDVEMLAAGPPPPSSAQAEDVEAQRRVIAQAYAGWATGDFAEAKRLAQRVEAAAESIGYAPLRYEATLLRGDAASRLVQTDEAREALDRALQGALSIDDRPVAIAAAAGLACVAAGELGQPEVGVAYGRTALGLTQGAGSVAKERAHALRCMGRALKAKGAFEDAETHLREAIAVLDGDGAGEVVSVAKVRLELGQVLVRRRRFAAAKQEFQHGAAILREQLGPDSPDAVLASGEVASVMAKLGEYGPAEAEYRRVMDVWTRVAGPRTTNIGIIHSKLGNMFYGQDRFPEAEVEFVAARELLTETLGADHPTVLATEASLANVWSQQDRLDEAGAAYADVIDRFSRILAPEHATLVALRSSAAQVQLQQHRYPAAMETLAPVAEACTAGPDVPDDTCGDVELALARAQFQLGDRASSSAHLAEAERRYTKADRITDDVQRVIDGLKSDLAGTR